MRRHNCFSTHTDACNWEIKNIGPQEGFFTNRLKKNWIVIQLSNLRTAFLSIAKKGSFHFGSETCSLIDLNVQQTPVIVGYAERHIFLAF